MNVLSWNCRGLSTNSSPLLSLIKNLSILNLDFILLSEIKCTVSSLIPFFNRIGFKHSTGKDSEGSSGGLFLCWADSLKVSVILETKNVISCKIVFPNGCECYVAFVYGSPVLANRNSVWKELENLFVKFNSS